ncbi:MAG TPA: hypothetical protein VGO89_17005 [Streptomyces sp.]|nr:hypothetical protein [Streptomyces sp.]
MNKLWLFDPSENPGSWKKPEDGRVFREIRTDAQPQGNGEGRGGDTDDGSGRTVAYVERSLTAGGVEEYRKARKKGIRAFALWADPHRVHPFARVLTRSVQGGASTFEVLGPAGEQLALITRQKAFSKRIRTRWTVQQAGRPAVTGAKGRVFWYFVWYLLLPVWAFLAFGSPDVPRTPVRTRWKLDGQSVLDWRSDQLNVLAEWWDPRVVSALVILTAGHAGWAGKPWDDTTS